MTNITQMPGTKLPDILGSKRFGHSVIVDGRIIPYLAAVSTDGGYDLYLDDRFCIHVAKDQMHQVSWLVANALAVGAGYKWIGGEKHGVPFAPEVVESPGEEKETP